MSITLHQEPEAYTPGYSPQIFLFTSNQVAQPNFSFTVVCTDMLTSETQTFEVSPRPDNYGIFDAKVFSEIFLTHYIPINEYGWKQADGVRKIRVNIGETYGTTPVYASGSNEDFIVWNAILDWKRYPSYDPNDFVYASGNTVYLTGNVDEDTYVDRSNYLYALTDVPGVAQYLLIETYDQLGNFIAASEIDNPFSAEVDYEDRYFCIDVGYKGLTNINPLEVSGTFPIITSEVAYYEISDVYDNGAELIITPIKTIHVKCEPRFDVNTLHYLDKNGNFQTLNFAKLSRETLTKQQTNYSKIAFERVSNTYTYSPSSRVKQVLSSERTNRLTLTTDWLTDEQVEYHQGILDSPVVYLDLGSSEDYLQVMVVSDSYLLNKRYNERLYTMQIEIEYAHTNSRQVG